MTIQDQQFSIAKGGRKVTYSSWALGSAVAFFLWVHFCHHDVCSNHHDEWYLVSMKPSQNELHKTLICKAQKKAWTGTVHSLSYNLTSKMLFATFWIFFPTLRKA